MSAHDRTPRPANLVPPPCEPDAKPHRLYHFKGNPPCRHNVA